MNNASDLKFGMLICPFLCRVLMVKFRLDVTLSPLDLMIIKGEHRLLLMNLLAD